MNRLNNVKELYEEYGDKPLSEIIQELKGDNKFECPECKGLGYVSIEYNAYPSGLPDSGFVYKPGYKHRKCNLCNGLGYTEYEFEPHYVQDGWQVKNKDNIKKKIEQKILDIRNNPDYYGDYSSMHLIEKEQQKIKFIDKMYPLIVRKE